MKILKAICLTVILALMLSLPAYAGEVQTPGNPAPVPTPRPTSNMAGNMSAPTVTNLGDTSTVGYADLLWVLASIY
jgi:hypothetical protein